LDILKNNGAKWDMIGMSLYPYWTMQNTDFSYTTADAVIADCIANIKKVCTKYNCDVMIVETGMECADDNGKLANSAILAEGKRQLARILKECKENTAGHCKGVFYWEPECKPSQYHLGAFTEDGRPTVIMDAFK
jgi:arabinogalactan endo-1,4-beta-galactosidase